MASGKFQEWLTEEGLLQIEAWARDGLTDEQISHNMGIRRSTLYEWKNKFADISAALKRGKAVVDIQVENALLKRALGYFTTETIKERVVDEDGESHLEVTRQVTKEVLPDVTAQIYWLKNRKPESWRDKRDVNVNGNINNPFDKLTTEQLMKLVGDEDEEY